jgi:peptide chain release factor 2
LELLLEDNQRLHSELEELQNWLPRIESERRRDALSKAAARSLRATRTLDLLELRLSLAKLEDSTDAFVLMRQIGATDRDFVEVLLEMYNGWASRTGCTAQLLERSLPEHNDPPSAALAVTGAHAYGLFRGETGLHRFSMRDSALRRRSVLVQVSVFPELPLQPQHVLEIVTSSRALARTGGRRRSWARAVHNQSLEMFEAENDLDPEANADALRRLLAARIRHKPPDNQEDRVVRSYYMEPDREVRDVPSGIRTTRFSEVLAGELHEFVLGRDAARSTRDNE